MYENLKDELNDFLTTNSYFESRFSDVQIGSSIVRNLYLTFPSNYIVICDDNLAAMALTYFPQDKVVSLGTDIKASDDLVKYIVDNFSTNFLVAFGSGTINDLCKYAAFLLGCEYILIPTAASMNGYTSSFASIKFGGLNKSLKARLAKNIYIDLDIVCKAPYRLTYSGIGDVLCRINCEPEWKLNSEIFGGEYREDLYKKITRLEDSFIADLDMAKIGDEKMRLLFKLILYSGLLMTVAGGSMPASQSEHVMTHSFDLLYPEIAQNYFHGEKVAFFTKYSLKIWQELSKTLFNQDLNTDNYKKLYHQLELEKQPNHLIELAQNYQKKLIMAGFAKKYLINEKKHWKNVINHVLCPSGNSRYYSHVKVLSVVSSRLENLLSNERVENTINISPFIRDRFTIVDLYVLAGGRAGSLLLK